MAQRVLPYEYEIEEGKAGLTSFGGLPTYLDLASVTGLLKSIDRRMRIRTGEQGGTDRQMILSLLLLNLVGGDCGEDKEKLREKGKAFIPASNEHLKAFGKINAELIGFGHKEQTATLDMDATIAATMKDNALY